MSEKLINVPVGLFVFNRLDVTKIVFEEIRKAKPKKFYLISDGGRDNCEGEKERVKDVREYIEKNIDWPCEVYKNYAVINMGCKKRMASGISWIFEHEEMAIILEDDCKPTQDFFAFMEELLNRYQNNEQIAMISGCKIINNYVVKDSYTFSKFPSIWGWGTWKRAWAYYDINILNWKQLEKDGFFKKFYNFYGYLNVKKNFESVYVHECDTWDYQWLYAVLMNKKLNIVPCVNMIENLGFGRDDATHTRTGTNLDFRCYPMAFPLKHPEKVKINEEYDRAYNNYFWGIQVIVNNAKAKIRRKIAKIAYILIGGGRKK